MAHRVIKEFEQRISERLDYDFDFTNFLGADTIQSRTISVDPTGLTVDLIENTTKIVKVWLEGGTDGTDYVVTCSITSVGGRTKYLDATIKIRHN